MESSRIKGGGGALTRTARKRPRKDASVNIELTRQVQRDPRYVNYVKWLTDNGCIFPSVRLK